MTKIDKPEKIDHGRRRLLAAATVSAAVAQLGLTRSAPAQGQSSGLPDGGHSPESRLLGTSCPGA